MAGVAPATVGREACKERMVEPPYIAGGQLRGLVEFLARAFAFADAGAGGYADAKERLRWTCSRAQNRLATAVDQTMMPIAA